MSLHNVSEDSVTSPSRPEAIRLFQAFGVEIEYMLVDAATLKIVPAVDRIFEKYNSSVQSDIERGEIEISNELVRHVVEFKSAQPTSDLEALEQSFHREILTFNRYSREKGYLLMPTGMHPWMDPEKEMELWPHDNSVVYEAYDRIFNCKGHGWSNLQSTHLNLPFSGEGEFARLHAAIRVILPLVPALAASSPLADGQKKGFSDYRLEVYRKNQAIIPEIAGRIIPEPCFSFHSYQQDILNKMYEAIRPHDPQNVLQEEWLNSRGAIARFDRNAIEIRLIDVQECPKADLAICWLIIETIKGLVSGHYSGPDEQRSANQEVLVEILGETIKHGEKAIIENNDYLQLFGLPRKKYTAGEVWSNILERVLFTEKNCRWSEPLEVILKQGTLSSRIMKALGSDISANAIKDVYAKLSNCLQENKMFNP